MSNRIVFLHCAIRSLCLLPLPDGVISTPQRTWWWVQCSHTFCHSAHIRGIPVLVFFVKKMPFSDDIFFSIIFLITSVLKWMVKTYSFSHFLSKLLSAYPSVIYSCGGFNTPTLASGLLFSASHSGLNVPIDKYSKLSVWGSRTW